MVSATGTKELLRKFTWDSYEFWANELDTDDDSKVWPMVLGELEEISNNPFGTQGETLDAKAKTEFISQLKIELGLND